MPGEHVQQPPKFRPYPCKIAPHHKAHPQLHVDIHHILSGARHVQLALKCSRTSRPLTDVRRRCNTVKHKRHHQLHGQSVRSAMRYGRRMLRKYHVTLYALQERQGAEFQILSRCKQSVIINLDLPSRHRRIRFS